MNDNIPQAFQQDRIGSGGWLPTLSSLLINAYDIAQKPLAPSTLLSNLEGERKSLELAAAGRPLAAYIRWLIFKEDMPEMPKKRTRGESASQDHKQLAKLLGALGKSRIASNINQLAKAANSGSLPVSKEIIKALNESVAAIKWMREALIKGMGIKPQSKDEDSSDDIEG